MAYELTFKKNLANKANYGSSRDVSKIKYLVIHYTTNDGDTDENNGKYFANNVVKASAHYFVDDDSVTISVPDNYVAWAVGGNKYNNGGGRLYGTATNSNTLSIEICDDVKNGVVYPSQATIDNVIILAKIKMVEYGLDKAHVIRHYDVNGKPCPKYWVEEAKWKNEFWNKLTGWVLYNNKWYWLDDNGNVIKSTWKQIDGFWYYFDEKGCAICNAWKQLKSVWYYFDKDCKAVTEWQKLSYNGSTSWYYFDPTNCSMYSSKWVTSNGKDYYLEKSGVMATYCYVKSTSKNMYYWINKDGVYESQWDTATPDLTKYKVVV